MAEPSQCELYYPPFAALARTGRCRADCQRHARLWGEHNSLCRPQGDLLVQIEQRGKWPSPEQRYCTSDHKRAQVDKLFTQIVAEVRAIGPLWAKQHVRILHCMGLRAEESPKRAAKLPFYRDERASNGKRTVDVWLPIHHLSEAQVWERIRRAGTEVHYAYDLGLERVSCVFCIIMPKPALMLAGQRNPALLDQYVKVEQKINHRFRVDVSLTEIQNALARGEQPGPMTPWKAA